MTEPLASMSGEPKAIDWAEAVRYVRSFYPEDVFPWPSDTTEGQAARMARLTCDNIEREARRLALGNP